MILALALLPVKGWATNLYHASVVLDEANSADNEQLAKQQALQQVLVKVSGQRTITENPVIKKALGNSAFISQIGYGEENGQRTLDVTYDSKQIYNLLVQAKAPVWSEPRPELTVWVVEDSPSGRQIVWEQSNSPLISELKADAERRGLPVLVPIGDFQDVTAVDVADLWGSFLGPVTEASKRYETAGILIARVRANGVSWTLVPDAKRQQKPVEGRANGPVSQSLDRMINSISDYYASRNSVVLGGESEGSQLVAFDGVNSARDFFALEKLLGQLNSVGSVTIDRIQNGEVRFRLVLLAPVSVFTNELENDSRITSLGTAVVMPEPSDVQPPVDNDTPAVISGETVPTDRTDAPVEDITAPESTAISEGGVGPATPAVTGETMLKFMWTHQDIPASVAPVVTEPETVPANTGETAGPEA